MYSCDDDGVGGDYYDHYDGDRNGVPVMTTNITPPSSGRVIPMEGPDPSTLLPLKFRGSLQRLPIHQPFTNIFSIQDTSPFSPELSEVPTVHQPPSRTSVTAMVKLSPAAMSFTCT